MSFSALTLAETSAGKAIIQALMRKILANFDYLYGILGTIAGSDVPNGSFEVDSDANGTPDNWTFFTYSGGTTALDTTTPAHGAAGIKMVHPGGAGNGGGYATSDYMPCNQLEPVILQLVHSASAAGMKNQVIIFWYDKDKVACSTPSTTVYDSTSNPTSATLLLCGATPPNTARFFKVRLVGGENSVNVAGTAYWDGLTISPLIYQTYSKISATTLAEQSTVDSIFNDQGSFTIIPRISGFPMRLVFIAQLKVSGDGAQRFRVGSVYSGEITSASPAYLDGTFTIDLIPTGLGVALTVTQQLKGILGGTAYGKKTASSDTVSPIIII